MKSENTFAWYNKRTWLNDPDVSTFTGSVVCYLSAEEDNDGKGYDSCYLDAVLELSDCQDKVRIHSDAGSSEKSFDEYIRKIELLRDEIESYLVALKETRVEFGIRKKNCDSRNESFEKEQKERKEKENRCP